MLDFCLLHIDMEIGRYFWFVENAQSPGFYHQVRKVAVSGLHRKNRIIVRQYYLVFLAGMQQEEP
jgi:hypothetical protein